MVYLIVILFSLLFSVKTYSVEFDPRQCGLLKDRIAGAFIGSAIGDALGRITEFIPSYAAIENKFGPGGLQSFADVSKVFDPRSASMVIPYTDDTVMALELTRVIFEGRQQRHSVTVMMDNLARAYAQLLGVHKYIVDPLFAIRAHGINNLKACAGLENMIIKKYDQRNSAWWARQADHFDKSFNNAFALEGGCGSVMRCWPIGILYADSLPMIKELADKQSWLTHRHPMARAACVAMAVGISQSFLQKSPEEVFQAMISAAQEYDEKELLYKKDAKKSDYESPLNAESIARDELLTSDMIRYAYQMAQEGKEPLEVLGAFNDKQANMRSPYGYLLGWSADEAVSAALYIFMRHPDDLLTGIQEAVNTPGDSDTIATLVGAMIGARTGLQTLHYQKFDYSALENNAYINTLASLINAYLGQQLSKHGLYA